MGSYSEQWPGRERRCVPGVLGVFEAATDTYLFVWPFGVPLKLPRPLRMEDTSTHGTAPPLPSLLL